MGCKDAKGAMVQTCEGTRGARMQGGASHLQNFHYLIFNNTMKHLLNRSLYNEKFRFQS